MTEKELNTPNSVNQLINVSDIIINGETVNSVDARELHCFFDSGQNFSDWIKNRIKKYEFVKGFDFITNHNGMFIKQIKEDSSRRSEIERELGCKFAIYDQR